MFVKYHEVIALYSNGEHTDAFFLYIMLRSLLHCYIYAKVMIVVLVYFRIETYNIAIDAIEFFLRLKGMPRQRYMVYDYLIF